MDNEAVKQLLEEKLEGCEAQVQGDGRHFELTIISDVFEGLSSLKRQQLVYAAINDRIADGSVHAVNMKLFTKEQWASQS